MFFYVYICVCMHAGTCMYLICSLFKCVCASEELISNVFPVRFQFALFWFNVSGCGQNETKFHATWIDSSAVLHFFSVCPLCHHFLALWIFNWSNAKCRRHFIWFKDRWSCCTKQCFLFSAIWLTSFQVFACVSPHVQDCRTGEVGACKVSMDTWVGSYAAQQEAFLKETTLKNRRCKRLNLDT